MPDRQLAAEAARLRAELAVLRATVSNLRERQQRAMSEWQSLMNRLPLA